jgi:chorismate synthase
VSFSIGSRLRLTVFGASHGQLVGSTLEGLPAGIRIASDEVSEWMDRRRPSVSDITTQRKEDDSVSIVSGLVGDRTDGSPLTFIIYNRDAMPSHYDELKERPRPGHADLTMFLKYGEYRNYSGGGFLSGRMTAPLVAAGSVCLSILGEAGVDVNGWVQSIGDIQSLKEADSPVSAYSTKTRIPDTGKDAEAVELIKKIMSEGDSIGGSIRISIRGLPGGLGEPFFDSVESVISHAIFSIPAVKAIEFGAGFRLGSMKGSEALDTIFYDGQNFRTRSNNNGGILGGITNGMPVDFRVAIKPTSSIRKELDTVNLVSKEKDTIRVRGRHDPCIAIRALPVVQCMSAFSILDLMMSSGKSQIIQQIFPSGQERQIKHDERQGNGKGNNGND